MAKKTLITGIKPTNAPHLGNYLGAIRPALDLAEDPQFRSLLFVADYHALTVVHDAKLLKQWTYEVAATWLACGLNPDNTVIYKQSDVPEVFELSWILSCMTAKGLMNRAHAYKAKVQENEEAGKADVDFGVNMGLYTYPILMAADILLFDVDVVPVGEDQVQHVEIARDIAQRFNNTFGETLKVPVHMVREGVKTVPGLDGRKMSKSYGNHIPLFCDEKTLRKLVMKIKTDSSPPEAPKNPDDSLIMDIFKAFATSQEVEDLVARYRAGIGWGEAKQILFEKLNSVLAPKRDHFNDLLSHPAEIDRVLAEGAKKAREMAKSVLNRARQAIGIG